MEPTFQSVRKLEPNEIDSRPPWQRGEVIFQGEPLEQVLAEVSRYTTDPLRDRRTKAARRARRRLLQGRRFDSFLASLRENFLIDWQRDEDGRIVLTAAPSAP